MRPDGPEAQAASTSPPGLPAASRRLFVLGGLLAVIALFLAFERAGWVGLDAWRAHQQAILGWTAAHPLGAAAGYLLLTIVGVACLLPVAALMMVVAGALFGLPAGIVLASVATAFGSLAAFVAARLIFRDGVRRRLGPRLARIEAGVARDGIWYLLALRLTPVVPSFIVNLAMGLTPMPALRFLWVSQLGMLLSVILYVNAGTQLAQLQRLEDVLSPGLIQALTLLALVPWLGRLLFNRLRAARAGSHTR